MKSDAPTIRLNTAAYPPAVLVMKQKVYKNVIFDTHVWAQYTAKFVFVALFLFFVFLVYFFTPHRRNAAPYMPAHSIPLIYCNRPIIYICHCRLSDPCVS